MTTERTTDRPLDRPPELTRGTRSPAIDLRARADGAAANNGVNGGAGSNHRTPTTTHAGDHPADATRPARSGPARALDLIVPALNEEDRIGDTIRALAEERPNFDAWEVKVVVVDNGCVDATSEAVDAATAGTDLPAEVLGCRRRGKGAAVRYGVDRSTAPYIGYCDADLSTPPSALAQGLALLDAGWDVVIGSRRCIGANYVVPQNRMRRAGSAAFHLAAARMAPAASDTQCGFKLFRRHAARSLLADGSIDGFAFDVEVLARATSEQSFSMIELPVQWQDQDGSTFRPVADGMRSFIELGRVYGALRSRRRGRSSAAR